MKSPLYNIKKKKEKKRKKDRPTGNKVRYWENEKVKMEMEIGNRNGIEMEMKSEIGNWK